MLLDGGREKISIFQPKKLKNEKTEAEPRFPFSFVVFLYS